MENILQGIRIPCHLPRYATFEVFSVQTRGSSGHPYPEDPFCCQWFIRERPSLSGKNPFIARGLWKNPLYKTIRWTHIRPAIRTLRVMAMTLFFKYSPIRTYPGGRRTNIKPLEPPSPRVPRKTQEFSPRKLSPNLSEGTRPFLDWWCFTLGPISVRFLRPTCPKIRFHISGLQIVLPLSLA